MKLQGYLEARKKIRLKLGQLEEIDNLCTHITSDPTQERVQTSSAKDRLGALVAKKADLEAEIMQGIIDALDTMNEIEEAINALEDPDEQIVLQERYIENKGWDEISEDVGMSRRTAIRIKNKAISKIGTQCHTEM